jgi:hypothetical protein
MEHDDIPEEPKSDLDKWKPIVDTLIELRDNLRRIQVANSQRMLDRIDQSVVQSECSEANDLINHIMKK